MGPTNPLGRVLVCTEEVLTLIIYMNLSLYTGIMLSTAKGLPSPMSGTTRESYRSMENTTDSSQNPQE